jgi:hypothetical protein
MTNEQINIAIAEACGWKLVKDDPNHEPYMKDPIGYKIAINSLQHRLPNYCNNLNAIHDAVMTLPEKKRILYGMYLASTCGHMTKKTVGLWHISTATARHHAEAFLKTLGKWEGAK